jgi:peptide-methionine (S)-S-oxide reductase
MPEPVKTEIATFAAGCFWGVEELFRAMPGVVRTRVGYTGGTTDAPTYEIVCTDQTGHAEAVEVTYDPSKVSYAALLQVFWDNHNPTTPNQQGPDYGSQYRSAIFYHSPSQRESAETSKVGVERSGRWKKPIVTQIVPAQRFYEAEAYHQQYLLKRGLGSCHI